MPSYMPRSDAEFDEWFHRFASAIHSIATQVNLPPNFVAQVDSVHLMWGAAYMQHQEAQNTAQAATETKNEIRVDAQEIVRTVVNLLQALPDLTDAQRELLGITVRDTTPTSVSPEYVMELEPPLLKLDLRSGQVTIHFGVNPGNEKENAKPKNIGGVKIWYRVGGAEWEWLGYDTNSPYMHNIDLSTCGALEYRAQWLDKKMRTGLFSMVAQATVS